jgi:hypothetical protein
MWNEPKQICSVLKPCVPGQGIPGISFGEPHHPADVSSYHVCESDVDLWLQCLHAASWHPQVEPTVIHGPPGWFLYRFMYRLLRTDLVGLIPISRLWKPSCEKGEYRLLLGVPTSLLIILQVDPYFIWLVQIPAFVCQHPLVCFQFDPLSSHMFNLINIVAQRLKT